MLGYPTSRACSSDPYGSFANLKLAIGWSTGIIGFEGVLIGSFSGRFDDKYTDPTNGYQLRSGYPMLSGFFGAGARVTSKHPIIRFTGALAFGAGPHQFLNDQSNLLQCNGDNKGGSSPCGPNGSSGGGKSPGYTSLGMVGDLGILLGGGAPSAKFSLGVAFALDFPPDVTIVPDPRVPPKYLNANGSATVLHGPQFFIGPTIGVGFGH